MYLKPGVTLTSNISYLCNG